MATFLFCILITQKMIGNHQTTSSWSQPAQVVRALQSLYTEGIELAHGKRRYAVIDIRGDWKWQAETSLCDFFPGFREHLEQKNFKIYLCGFSPLRNGYNSLPITCPIKSAMLAKLASHPMSLFPHNWAVHFAILLNLSWMNHARVVKIGDPCQLFNIFFF